MGWSPHRRNRQEATPCPVCGSTEVRPVIFGLPGPELVEQSRRGEVVLGGCMVLPDVRGACKQCGHWRTTRE